MISQISCHHLSDAKSVLTSGLPREFASEVGGRPNGCFTEWVKKSLEPLRLRAEPLLRRAVLEKMTLADLRRLHQKIVLVQSSRDRGNPPTALRGTIEVHDAPGARGSPVVQIALDFPQMFSTRAHQHTLTLDAPSIDRLLASERNGTYELTVDVPLDPVAPVTTS